MIATHLARSELAVNTRRQRYSGVTEDQANSVRRRQEDMPGASVDDVSGITLRTGPTTRNATDTEHLPTESPNSESDVEIHTQPTQGSQIRKKRLRWTDDMNEYLYRSYLIITKFETSKKPYSGPLYDMMISKYPQLASKTRQNILDQRRQLFINNRIDRHKANQIRHEVEIELGQRQSDEHPDATPTENLGQVNPTVTSTDELDEYFLFQRNLTLYKGVDPLLRPKLPRLKTSRETVNILNKLNNILEDALNDIYNLSDYHDLIYVGAYTALNLHKQNVNTDNLRYTTHTSNEKKPKWQLRLERNIAEVRNAIGKLTQYTKSAKPTNRLTNKINEIVRKYRDQENQNHMLILDKLKQKLAVYANRIRRYKESYLRKKQNYTFHCNQKKFYRSLAAEGNDTKNETPEQEEAVRYWKGIWEQQTNHNRKANWLTQQRKEAEKILGMSYNEVTTAQVKEAITKTHNWKAPGPDGVHNYWLKKFHVTHTILAKLYTEILHNPQKMPAFMTMGITYLLPKSSPSVKDPAKYRPITCLPTLYKVLTSIICNQIYLHLDKHGLMPEEQKGCRKGSRGCKEQLTIDTVLTEEAKQLKKDLYVAYIDYKKAFDSVPHSLLIEILEVNKIDKVIVNLLRTLMHHWTTQLHLQGTNIGKIEIKKGIFQGDALSALWYCVTLAPLSNMLNTENVGYRLQTGQQIDHLAYMDDIKLIASTKTGLDTLIKTTKKYSDDTNMEFGIEKCKISVLRKGQWMDHPGFRTDEEHLIRGMSKEESYPYLGLDQARGIRHKEMKDAIKNKLLKRTKSILKSQLSAKNKVTAINTYAIPTVTYSFGIVKWSNTDLHDLNRAVRTLFVKYRARHPKSPLERFYLPREQGGRGITDLREAYQKQLDNLRTFFHQKSEISPYHNNIVRADRNLTPLNLGCKAYKPMGEIPTTNQRIAEWKAKQLHGRYPTTLDQEHIDRDASNAWLKHTDLQAETEGFIMSIQDQVVATRNYRKYIIKDATVRDDKCRLCHTKAETIEHVISACSVLASSEYLKRHDNIAKVVHQEICKNIKIVTEFSPYYQYKPEPILENENHKVYWNKSIITDHRIDNNRPDIVLQEKDTKTTYLIDIAVPAAHNIQEKHREKIQKYLPLAAEIKTIWKQDKVTVIPIIIGATGEIPLSLHRYLSDLNLPPKIYITFQKLAILGTCHITRKVLNIST